MSILQKIDAFTDELIMARMGHLISMEVDRRAFEAIHAELMALLPSVQVLGKLTAREISIETIKGRIRIWTDTAGILRNGEIK